MKCKISILILVLFLVFPILNFGEGNSHAGNFSDYINNSEVSFGDSADKNHNINHPTNVHPQESSNNTDFDLDLKGIPARWKACSKDSECTAGVVDCVSWQPLNKEYLDKVSRNLKACSDSIDPGFQPKTVCFANACRTTNKTTNVSWEDWLRERRKN